MQLIAKVKCFTKGRVHGQKDIISKEIFKRILIDIATYIFKLDLASVELIETEQQRIEDRRNDLTAKVVDSSGQRFILHLEIQNQNQDLMPHRMLRYFSDIAIHYPDETIYQYLLYIGKEPLTMADGIRNANLQYRYKVIDMHTLDYRFFMRQNSADALVLAVLCDFKDMKPRAVVHEILTRLLALMGQDSKGLREYVMMLEVLATNRDLNVDIQQEFEMLEIEVEKLPSYLMGEERGEKRGEQRKAIAVAKQLFQLNMPLEQIAKISGLSIDELQQLKDTDEQGDGE